MAFNFRRFLKGINLVPNAGSTVTADGDLAYRTDTNLLELHNGSTVENVATSTNTLTLTNKTLTSPVINTPTGIVKGDVGLGNVDNTSDATKNAASATLTNKTINGPDNTLTNISLTASVTGTLPVANGGTGATSLTSNNVILGNGTSAVQFVAPGTSGNVLTSNGTTWASSTPTTGVNTIGTIDSQSKSANGAVITGGVNLIMQTADGSKPGVVSTAAQTIAGIKTFTSSPVVQRATTSNEGGVRFHTSSTLDWTIGTGVDAVGSNYAWGQGASQTVRMQLNSDGKFILGGASGANAYTGRHEIYNNSTANGTLNLRNMSTSTSSDGIPNASLIKGSTTNTAGTNHFIDFYINAVGTASGYIATNGANSAAFFNTSDMRLKKDIEPINNAIDKIMQLNPVTFKWKSDNTEARGFIAQEVEQVFPHMVAKSDDGGRELEQGDKPWSMTESGFAPYLVKAIQELKQEIEALKAQIGGN